MAVASHARPRVPVLPRGSPEALRLDRRRARRAGGAREPDVRPRRARGRDSLRKARRLRRGNPARGFRSRRARGRQLLGGGLRGPRPLGRAAPPRGAEDCRRSRRRRPPSWRRLRGAADRGPVRSRGARLRPPFRRLPSAGRRQRRRSFLASPSSSSLPCSARRERRATSSSSVPTAPSTSGSGTTRRQEASRTRGRTGRGTGSPPPPRARASPRRTRRRGSRAARSSAPPRIRWASPASVLSKLAWLTQAEEPRDNHAFAFLASRIGDSSSAPRFRAPSRAGRCRVFRAPPASNRGTAAALDRGGRSSLPRGARRAPVPDAGGARRRSLRGRRRGSPP